jgi:hypothetical protein
MIDRNHGTALPDALGIDLDSRFRERSVDVVNRDRVMRVRRAVVDEYTHINTSPD